MSLPASQPLPDDEHFSAARHRHARHHLAGMPDEGLDERAAFLDSLAARAIPPLSYFLLSLVSGLVFGLGCLLNSPAVSVLGAVVAPFLGPFTGLSLATIVGSGRFFLRSLVCALLGVGLAFAGGWLTGYAPRILPGLPMPLTWAYSQSQFSWPALSALVVLVILATVSYVRDQAHAFVPAAGVAYLLYLPAAAAGFGLSAGSADLWPHGVIVFLVHLAVAVVTGTITLALLGLRPLTLFGYSLGTTIALSCLVILVGLSGVGSVLRGREDIPVVVPTPVTPSATVPTATSTPVPPTSTRTPVPSVTQTLIPSFTPTDTITPAPTPVYAIINAQALNGAYIRSEPRVGSKILTSLLNGTLVKVLPDSAQDGGTFWAHIETTEGLQGWIVQSLLVTATPAPGW